MLFVLYILSVPAKANGEKAKQNESKTIRDKDYTHLKELVDKAGQVYFIPKSKFKRQYISYFVIF